LHNRQKPCSRIEIRAYRQLHHTDHLQRLQNLIKPVTPTSSRSTAISPHPNKGITIYDSIELNLPQLARMGQNRRNGYQADGIPHPAAHGGRTTLRMQLE
jgi:hypothetical protein